MPEHSQTLTIEVNSVSERYYIQESVDMEMGGRISHAEGVLHTLLEFCQRNSTTSEESERQVLCTQLAAVFVCMPQTPCHYASVFLQAMWFPIFDNIHNLQKKYETSTNIRLIEGIVQSSNGTLK